MRTLMINKKQIKRIQNAGENGIQILANIVARAHGYNKATEIKIGKELKVDHYPYGFSTYSGKFFPHVTTTRWSCGGFYSPAITEVTLPLNFVCDLFLK